MRILAIDPGYDRLGVAVLERQQQQDVLLFSSCVTTTKTSAHADRLGELGIAVEALFVEYEPEAVAIETLFFNKNQKTATGVAEARGVILYLAKRYGAAVHEYGPQEIKVAVTGYGKSDKVAVIDMVKRLIQNAPIKALDDEYDAIAIGITCLATLR